MKISIIIIILSTAVAVLGVISRYSGTFAGRFGLTGDYFLKNALLNSYAYLIILFVIPLIFAISGKLSKQNALITLLCGVFAAAVPLYSFFIRGDGALGTILLIVAGVGLLAGGGLAARVRLR
ncbi:MAG: hypothetical protein LBP51_05215 [Deferribacteraceae bacterium]|jgi:hypothetical protein|nr:hypothetical protein [Deferribacteraceae bacterium]